VGTSCSVGEALDRGEGKADAPSVGRDTFRVFVLVDELLPKARIAEGGGLVRHGEEPT
jgi:hypothetical protein